MKHPREERCGTDLSRLWPRLAAAWASVGATSLGTLEAGKAGLGGGAGAAAALGGAAGGGAAGAVGSIMTAITLSLTPASLRATKPSTETSNLVFDCLILAMMRSSEILALTSLMTSWFVIGAGAGGLAGAVFLGVAGRVLAMIR